MPSVDKHTPSSPLASLHHRHRSNSNSTQPSSAPNPERQPPSQQQLFSNSVSTTSPYETSTPSASAAQFDPSTTSHGHRKATPVPRLRSTNSTAAVSSASRPASQAFLSGPGRPASHMASYRARPESYKDKASPTAPLIHFAANSWKDDLDLDVSDEDEAFYTKDPDYHDLLPPKFQSMAIKAKNWIPRRVQRYFSIYFALLVITWIVWRMYVGPMWTENREITRKMDNLLPDGVFGSNMRPEFRDMIMVKSLDSERLPEEGDDRRLIFVGDVHGCRKELEELLAKVEFREGKDHLVLLGDMIAKGPDSPGVIALASRLSASCVRGNHEDKTLLSHAELHSHHAPLPGPEEDPSTMTDFMDEESFSHGDYRIRALTKQFNDTHIKYMRSCPVILRVGSIPGLHHYGELLAVHAGLVPGVPLQRQDPFQVMNMRSIDLDTRLPKENRDGGVPWERFWNHVQKQLGHKHRATVVYGHDSKRGKNLKKYSKGLDTGCVNGGKLTAWVLGNGAEKIISVKCKNHR